MTTKRLTLSLTAVALAATLALSACGGSTRKTTSATVDSSGAHAYVPTAAGVKNWASVWCTIQPGSSRTQLEYAMGPRTEDDGPDADKWMAFGDYFLASFDVNGNIIQMDAHLAPGSGTLGCDTTRPTL